MNIIFGDKAIEVRRFQDGANSPATRSNEHVGIDIRGKYPDEEKHFVVSLKNLHTGEPELTVSLMAESYSLPPSVLFQESRSLLAIAHSSEILFIDTNAKKIAGRLDIGYPIYYFFLYDGCDSFVIVHELGIVACDRHGTTLWNWSSHEVVTETNRIESKMFIKVFDDLRYVVDLNTGEAISS